MNIQSLSELAGLLSMLFVIVGAVIAAIYVGRNTANKTATEAQANAIEAMQAQIITLRGSIEDVTKANIRLQHTIDTICAALKKRGLIITISGEMINIEDSTRSTTIRIQDHQEGEASP